MSSPTRRTPSVPYLLRGPIPAGVLWLVCLAGCAKQPPPDEPPPPAPVKVAPSQMKRLGEWTELLGTTQPLPSRAARVSAVVEGRVVSVLGHGTDAAVKEGQRVKAGQVIIQLDDRVARANRAKAQSNLADMAEQIKQAELSVKLAALQVESLKSLEGGGTTPPAGRLVSRLDLPRAQIAQEDAESKLEGLKARQKAGKDELEALDQQLAFYTLRAPIDGHLGVIQVVPGQTLTAGTAVADVVDLEEVDAVCSVPPHVLPRLKLNPPQRARLLPGEESSDEPAGQVVFIAVQAQEQSGNFTVKVRFPNKDLRLRANAVVRVQVETSAPKERRVVPEAALMEDESPPAIIAVTDIETKTHDDKEEKVGKARKLAARLGVRDREHHLVEILGLEDPTKKEKVEPEGLLFVVEGGHGLKEGDAVKLEEEKEKEK